MLGDWANIGIKLITGVFKEQDSTQDYIYSNCYKVLGQDPNDELINELVSLKTGLNDQFIPNPIFKTEQEHLDLFNALHLLYSKIVCLSLNKKLTRKKIKHVLEQSMMKEANRKLN